MLRLFIFLALCQFVLSDNILIAPLLKDDLYGFTTELHPEENTQVWFKSIYIYIYALPRTIVIKSLTPNSTFNLCVGSKCVQGISYFEDKLNSGDSMSLTANFTKLIVEIDTYPPLTSPNMPPWLIAVITLGVIFGCIICMVCCILCNRRRRFANFRSRFAIFAGQDESS